MAMREYRKGNWTVEETMILIEAKKKDDERRKFLSRSSSKLQTSPSTSATTTTSKPVTELRWKWVEEYCWARNCYRSQNQCNDKWDNLMRDYKKVRDYQKTQYDSTEVVKSTTTTSSRRDDHNNIAQSSNKNIKSYWDMDKVERKHKGLPTNMLPQIYHALFDVVERSNNVITPNTSVAATSIATATTTATPTTVAQLLLPPSTVVELQTPRQPPSLPPQVAFHPSQPLPVLSLPHPSSTLLEAQATEPPPSPHQYLSPTNKKKRRGDDDNRGGEGPSGIATQTATATTAATTTSPTSLQEVSLAISRSATIISQAIQASEERQERRHREIMNLHESILRVEESRLEINRQGFNGLSDAINRLATSIYNWTNSQTNQQGPS